MECFPDSTGITHQSIMWRVHKNAWKGEGDWTNLLLITFKMDNPIFYYQSASQKYSKKIQIQNTATNLTSTLVLFAANSIYHTVFLFFFPLVGSIVVFKGSRLRWLLACVTSTLISLAATIIYKLAASCFFFPFDRPLSTQAIPTDELPWQLLQINIKM